MFTSYIVSAFRAIKKQKQHFILNSLGLSVGLAAAILIALYVQFERSYDHFQPNSERTYRLDQYFKPMRIDVPIVPAAATDTFAKISGVEGILNLLNLGSKQTVVNIKGQEYSLKNSLQASANIQEFIKLDTLSGDIKTGLSKPNHLIITRSEALRLLGKLDVVGVNLPHRNGSWTIAAVIEDLPDNTHLSFDSLSYVPPKLYDLANLRANNSRTYLRLTKTADKAAIAQAMEQFLIEQSYRGQDIVEVKLQGMETIYLTSNSSHEMKPSGSKKTVNIAMCLSALLMFVASINFINISIAQAGSRAKEVSVRKALGANKSQLVIQFLVESLLVVLLSTCFACIIIELLLPEFNAWLGKELIFEYRSTFAINVLVSALVLGLLSGLYPAVFMASFTAKSALNGAFYTGKVVVMIRKCLLILQSALAVSLMVAVILLHQQVSLLTTLPTGYAKEQRLEVFGIPTNKTYSKENNEILNKIKAIEGVEDAVLISDQLSNIIGNGSAITWSGADSDSNIVQYVATGFNAARGLGLTLLAGRDFSREFTSDWQHEINAEQNQASVLITESLANTLGYDVLEQAIGQFFNATREDGIVSSQRYKIVGVVADVNVGSARTEPSNLYFVCGLVVNTQIGLNITFNTKDFIQVKADLTRLLQQELSVVAPDLYLVEQVYQNLYQQDHKLSQLMATFAGLATFLTCMGIFGLSSFSVLRRQKEIAMRKVLGGTRVSIVNLLAKEFLVLVLLSILLAFPLTYWLVGDWLAGFNERIEQSVWVYLLAALVVAAITWLTVASLAFKASSTRPSLILRDE